MSNRALNVVVVESSPAAADVACDELVAAGHRVLRCHDAHGASFPCNGLVDGATCPLDREGEEAVDVALDVRVRPRPDAAPLEDGARCALRARLPLVIAG